MGEGAIDALTAGSILTVRTFGNVAKDEEDLRPLAKEDLKMATTTLTDKAEMAGEGNLQPVWDSNGVMRCGHQTD